MFKKHISSENTTPSSTRPDSMGLSVDKDSVNSSLSTSASFINNTLIGESISITGDITGNEDIIIHGAVSGSISLPSNMITIGNEASIDAHVNANCVDIAGNVLGTIEATDIVWIRQSGHVKGNIAALRVVLEDGCQFKGGIDTEDQKTAGTNKGADVAVKSSGFVKPANTGQDQQKNEKIDANIFDKT